MERQAHEGRGGPTTNTTFAPKRGEDGGRPTETGASPPTESKQGQRVNENKQRAALDCTPTESRAGLHSTGFLSLSRAGPHSTGVLSLSRAGPHSTGFFLSLSRAGPHSTGVLSLSRAGLHSTGVSSLSCAGLHSTGVHKEHVDPADPKPPAASNVDGAQGARRRHCLRAAPHTTGARTATPYTASKNGGGRPQNDAAAREPARRMIKDLLFLF